ncbi:MAG: BatA domain-containing protein, partial [Gemmatimonadaceae bacterium]
AEGGIVGLLAPAFLAGLMAIAIPVVIHMIHRERRETIPFPSLMFLRKIPYRSVRRQKIRHLLLLALRCLAIALLVAAFARPFFERRMAAAPAAGDGREVVILVDRSYSMAHAGRWTRAVEAARTVASQVRTLDRVSVVAFSSSAAQVVEPTNAASRVEQVLATVNPGSEPTRYASGLRMAAQILSASDMPRKEIVLISDFHKSGWSPNDDVAIPEGVAVRTVDVSRKETDDAAVSGVSVARALTGERARATVTARVMNLGATPKTVEATLDLAGRRVDARRVTIPAHTTSQVVFAGAPVSAAAARGVVRITSDSQPSNDSFFFTVAEEGGASALIIEPPRPRANLSLFVTRALSVADDPPVTATVKSVDALTPMDIRGRSLIILNEAGVPSGAIGIQLRAQVARGALLLIVPGDASSSGAATPEWRAVLPATVGGPTDRSDGGRWASVDFSNALFEPFRASRADFSSVAVTRYRALAPKLDSSQVIARLDDGSPLLVERSVGEGRILMWAGTLDPQWNDLPFHPLFVPLVHQLARRSVSAREARSWFVAPHVMNLATEDRDAVVESPSGQRVRVSPDSQRPSVELRERGFYEIRGGATAIGAGRPVAVNVDLAESDLSHMDPQELVAAVTSRAQRGATTAVRAPFEGTAQELERRQAIWWYLLLAALLLLAAETLFSNRLSRRSLEQRITGVS